MARALIVGCGCRGRMLGERLTGEGLAVRGTSRSAEGLKLIEDAGLEAAEADPFLPGTLIDLVADAALVVWLMGSAAGEGEPAAGVNGERLESVLARMVDTPVRGFAYEAAGSAPTDALATGRAHVETAAATWSIPVTFIDQAPGADWGAWAAGSAERVLGLLR